MNIELKKLSVRIQQSNMTIGSGLLYITGDQNSAYVLTAAHVLDNANFPIDVQCFPDDHIDSYDNFCFSINYDGVVIHPNYVSGSSSDTNAQNDVALIRLPWRSWMNSRSKVFFDQAYVHLNVEGFGYPANSGVSDICLDVIAFTPTESRITNVSNVSRCMSSLLSGDCEINHANRAQEMAGFSGTAIAAANQNEIILIGFTINIPGTNGLLGRTTLVNVYPAEELLQSEGIECAWKTILPPEQRHSIQSGRTIISSTRFFVHRETELMDISRKLSQNKIVVLSGMGGIGKTELARHYAFIHGETYTQCCFIPCSESLASGISNSIKIDGIERCHMNGTLEDDIQFSQRILNALKHQPDNTWLLIFDNVSPQDPLFAQIVELAQHKIITTRWSAQMWQCPVIDLSALVGFDSQKDLFEQYLNRTLSANEISDFCTITEIVAGHTLTMQLIALQCTESDMTLSEIRSALEADGIYTENPDEFSYGESLVERNMYGHIRAIWNLSNFSNSENLIMQGLSLISPNGISRREYKQWLQLESMHDINKLRRQGWIQTVVDDGQEKVFLHAVIGELIYRELYQINPMDLSNMLQALLPEINNRSLTVKEQARYLSYGISAAPRLLPSEDAIMLLNLTGLHLEYFRQLDKSIEILNRAKELVEQMDNSATILYGYTFNNLAVAYQTKGEYATSITHYQKSIEYYQKCGEDAYGNIGYALHNIAKLTFFNGNTEEALQIEIQAEPLIAQYNKTHLGEVFDLKRECHSQLFYKKYINYEKLACRPESNKVLLNRLQNSIEEHKSKILTYGELAIKYKQQYDASDKYEINHSKGDHAVNKALFKQDPQSAREIQEVLEFFIHSTGEQSEHTGNIYNKMCIIYEKLGDIPRACEYGEKAVNILSKHLDENQEALMVAKYNLKFAQDNKK